MYRASTQSITGDEAMTYNKFVWPPVAESFTTYDANNHVLHTFLCKLSVRWFGLTEFGLRVPSLAGGLLFLFSIWRLARYTLGRGWMCLFAVAAVALNPLVLDYLSAARGYSLALGFYFWGLFLLTRYLAEDYDRPVWLLPRAGVAFGLAVGANLVFLVPVVAAGGVFTLLTLRTFWRTVDRFWGPVIVPAFLILVLPLTRAGASNFYYGARSLEDMIRNLVTNSMIHKASMWRIAEFVPGFGSWSGVAAEALIPALALFVVVVAAVRRERTLVLLAGTGAAALGALIAGHALTGVPYPLGRTGIYWLPLFTLAVMLAIPAAWRAGLAGKAAGAACGCVMAAACALFAAGITTDQYPEWRYDAGTHRIVNVLRARCAAKGRVRLGVNWLFEPSLNFYRHKYHLDWIEPVTRDGPDGKYDYYVLLPKDAAVAAKLGLRPLYRDPVSEAVLAAGVQ